MTDYRSRMTDHAGIFDINLTIPRGSFTVITGRVGSGKTTLLRVLLGLLPLDAGEIRWNGELVTDPATFFVPPRSAYTPQVPRLFSEIAAGQYLARLAGGWGGFDGGGGNGRAHPRHRSTRKRSGYQLSAHAACAFPAGKCSGRPQPACWCAMRNCSSSMILSSALDVETEKQLWERLFSG